MTLEIRVKLCGLTALSDIDAAVAAGAAYVGFVFFPKSPRHLDVARAAAMSAAVPAGICKVALIVDADDVMLDNLTSAVPLDMLQLHGSETPDRVRAIMANSYLPYLAATGCPSDRVAALADRLELNFFHSTREGKDQTRNLHRVDGNTYTTRIEQLPAGRWNLQISTKNWRLVGSMKTPGANISQLTPATL